MTKQKHHAVESAFLWALTILFQPQNIAGQSERGGRGNGSPVVANERSRDVFRDNGDRQRASCRGFWGQIHVA